MCEKNRTVKTVIFYWIKNAKGYEDQRVDEARKLSGEMTMYSDMDTLMGALVGERKAVFSITEGSRINRRDNEVILKALKSTISMARERIITFSFKKDFSKGGIVDNEILTGFWDDNCGPSGKARLKISFKPVA